ncbi:hypothetical protein HDU97_010275 [Phlyctochytrium planicorne]|nr:hypothetical protein HDU97_010275 [Phlyctochytrium planicorne]
MYPDDRHEYDKVELEARMKAIFPKAKLVIIQDAEDVDKEEELEYWGSSFPFEKGEDNDAQGGHILQESENDLEDGDKDEKRFGFGYGMTFEELSLISKYMFYLFCNLKS